jgi:P27 family predicted phage terminase small subunit
MPNNVRQLRGNPGKRQTAVPIVTPPGLRNRPRGWEQRPCGSGRGSLGHSIRRGYSVRWTRASLATYCTAWEMCTDLRRLLSKEGTVIVGKRSKEPVKHPAWSQLQQASALQIKLARELGLTPGSRLRMPNPFDPDHDDDEVEASDWCQYAPSSRGSVPSCSSLGLASGELSA